LVLPLEPNRKVMTRFKSQKMALAIFCLKWT